MADISVVGLGKVGLALAATLADSGHYVRGVDSNLGLLNQLNNGLYHNEEPDIAERLGRTLHRRLVVGEDLAEAVAASEVTYLIVPTPSNDKEGFSLKFVRPAIEQIGDAIRRHGGKHHLVAVVSTVLPGSSDQSIVPWLEAASGRRIGAGLGYVYNPAFIALGDVVRGFVTPDFVLIGEADLRSGELIQQLQTTIVSNGAPMARMSLLEAEITKLASNVHETMRVAFANMLLALCEELGVADVDRITDALSHRARRVFRGAVSYGGPCWPRDNAALAAVMESLGLPAVLPRAIDNANRIHGDFVTAKVLDASVAHEYVGLLGLAYKTSTSVTDESFGIKLARTLIERGRKVVAWDPLVPRAVLSTAVPGMKVAKSPEECVDEAQTVAILLPLGQLRSMDWAQAMDKWVLDFWNVLPPSVVAELHRYRAVGRAHQKLSTDIGKLADLLTLTA